jgi:hypothetical protein
MRYNPFNPQSPAKPEFFVGRCNEIGVFRRYLDQTIHGSPMNMAIVGNRGMGKTSILSKFQAIAKNEKCMVCRISNLEANAKNIVELADFILTNMKLEYLSSGHINLSDKVKEFLKSITISVSFGDASLDVSFKRDATVGLFRSKLEEFWRNIKENYSAIVILIDEAESIERIESGLMFLREVFQRLAENSIKYMMVVCGKLNFPESMSEAFSPLNRFFPAVRLLYFTKKETHEFIEKSLGVVNCSIKSGAVDMIHEKSEGHPYIVVSMAFNIFNELDEKEKIITENIVRASLGICENRLEQDYFISLFHPLTPRSKELLLRLATELKKPAFTSSEAAYILSVKSSQIGPYIQEMYRKGCINKTERGKYQIFHGLFLNFLKRRAKNII